MQYLHVEQCGGDLLELDVKEFAHIFKVRRVKVGEQLFLRSLKDDVIYKYNIDKIDRKNAFLSLQGSKPLKIAPREKVTLGWCIVDAKTVEKTLPALNEIGVNKLAFVHCDYSQKNTKIDLDRLKRILISSSQQCGRSSLMDFEFFDSVENFLHAYPKSAIIDFGGAKTDGGIKKYNAFLVGCEGGFSKSEREAFAGFAKFGFASDMILKSESAAISIAAKRLL